jgi:hypothetical protein
MEPAYGEYATKIKVIATGDVDPEVLDMTAGESKLAQGASEHCRRIAARIMAEPESAGAFDADWEATADVSDSIRTEHDVLRLALSRKYSREFQSLEDAAAEADAARNVVVPAIPAKGNAGSDDRGSLRVWTSRSGHFQVKAKFLGTSDGKIILERTDGTVVKVPIDMLSEADQQFLVELSPPQKPAKHDPAK